MGSRRSPRGRPTPRRQKRREKSDRRRSRQPDLRQGVEDPSAANAAEGYSDSPPGADRARKRKDDQTSSSGNSPPAKAGEKGGGTSAARGENNSPRVSSDGPPPYRPTSGRRDQIPLPIWNPYTVPDDRVGGEEAEASKGSGFNSSDSVGNDGRVPAVDGVVYGPHRPRATASIRGGGGPGWVEDDDNNGEQIGLGTRSPTSPDRRCLLC